MTDPQPTPARPAEPGARAFAWGVWGLMTIGAFAFVLRERTDVPIWDDYLLVPAVVGAEPVTPGWLWDQTNEHRIPLPKLAIVGFGRLAGGDVRVGMLGSVLAMSALAAALLALSGRLGGPRATDAFYPVLLLHPGHAANFLWSFQFTPLLPTALATGLLVPIAAKPRWPGPAKAAWVGFVLALLPLCGGNGVVFVPPLAGWLILAAGAEARSGHPRAGRRAAAIGLAAVPGLALTAAYFRGFRSVPHPPAPGGVADTLRAAVQFAAGGLGEPAAWAWPWSGAATLGLVGLGAALVAGAWLRRPEERPRAAGLAAFLAGVAALALAVGWGRGWSGDRAGFADRYVAMATPAWCWVAVAVRWGAPAGLGRALEHGLFALVCVLLWPNAEAGFARARDGAAKAGALARDIRAGEPPYRILRRHTPYLYPDQDRAARLLPILRAGRVGPFADLRDDPPLRAERLPPEPVELRQVRWDAGTAEVVNVDPQITFALPAPRYVAGIRIRYDHANPQGAPARFQLTWKGPGQGGYADDRRFAHWNLPTGAGRETTVWVDAVIDRFRVQPDNQPGRFRIRGIDLLEPAR